MLSAAGARAFRWPPGTASPTPQTPSGATIPMVGGTYTGMISAWREEQLIGTYAVTMTVTQSGNRITVGGTIESDVLLMETVTGTIIGDASKRP